MHKLQVTVLLDEAGRTIESENLDFVEEIVDRFALNAPLAFFGALNEYNSLVVEEGHAEDAVDTEACLVRLKVEIVNAIDKLIWAHYTAGDIKPGEA